MIILVVWPIVGLICAIICAGMAGSRGRSGVLWGILGFFFGLLAILVLAIIGKDRSAMAFHAGYLPAATPPASKFDEIAKLKALLDSGVLTQAEFDKQKKALLS